MAKQTKVMVTGAGGFIGAEICDLLLKKGLRVYGTYHTDAKRLNRFKKNKNFKASSLDITHADLLNRLIKKIKPQAVFHTAAALPGKEIDAQLLFGSNVLGTLNLLEACRLNNVKKFIHSSSMSIYGTNPKYLPVDEKHPANPYDFYSLSKKAAEDLCGFYAQNYNLNIVILRYSGVFGPSRTSGAVGQFILNSLKDKPLNINNNISWDIVDVTDIAKANFLAYQKAEKLKYSVINIGRGLDINILDLAKKILTLSKSKSQIKIGPSFNKKPYRFYFDIKKAAKMLNFKPGSLDSSLKKYIDTLKT
ncbi:NAD-dependent epimerase/dehydratase family protein [Candidatus Peregrinibacteria bacterium]|nr:NAD-dependent epimerase/dehydratase family protein [Candidatus Peregrinibacteria bacterium]